jgi:hypothetical protein
VLAAFRRYGFWEVVLGQDYWPHCYAQRLATKPFVSIDRYPRPVATPPPGSLVATSRGTFGAATRRNTVIMILASLSAVDFCFRQGAARPGLARPVCRVPPLRRRERQHRQLRTPRARIRAVDDPVPEHAGKVLSQGRGRAQTVSGCFLRTRPSTMNHDLVVLPSSAWSPAPSAFPRHWTSSGLLWPGPSRV